jgi:hypothetical protein
VPPSTELEPRERLDRHRVDRDAGHIAEKDCPDIRRKHPAHTRVKAR